MEIPHLVSMRQCRNCAFWTPYKRGSFDSCPNCGSRAWMQCGINSLKRRKGLEPYLLSTQEVMEGRVSHGYNWWSEKKFYREDDEYEEDLISQWHFVTREEAIRDAISLCSQLMYGNINYDTWIYEEETGEVVAVVSFHVEVTYTSL